MRKITIILFLAIIAGGCYVNRKAVNVNSLAGVVENETVLEKTERQNITSAGFYIQKAEIEFNNQYGNQKFLASIKFEYPEKYLISLKSRTGIEGVRVFINKDSVFVNDRINKKLYIGTTLYLKKNFGVDRNLLPLIFGDLVINKSQKSFNGKCVNDKLMFNCIISGVNLNYSIDCRKGKSTQVVLKNSYLQESVNLKSDGFLKADNILVPRYLVVDDFNTNTKIRIKFLKIEHPWNGTVKFVAGKGYELIELL